METFGTRLKGLRKYKKLTQQQVAAAIQVKQSTISYYEKDKKQPELQTLEKLADFFGVSIDYLLLRTDNPEEYTANEKAFIESVEADLDVTAAELRKKFSLINATEEEIEEAIRYILIQRMMKEQK
ncbi:helix-turn-helix domain-containing protein [Lysinibacillus sp. 54212]|uniref:helix-turn-helix domain-containing protein n=1 Tax=Lysinibacillus sp. 54212 TaxID=3119829 RepID=UPI002FCCB31D